MGGVAKGVKKIVKKPLPTLLGGATGALLTGAGVFDRKTEEPQESGFALDPATLEANRAAILGLGKEAAGIRQTSRAQLADILAKSREQAFQEAIPAIGEEASAKGIYTGTGFSAELAREKGRLQREVESALAERSLQDAETEIASKEAALSRQLSLEDFIRQANVAKALGAQQLPQMGKGGGLGALSDAATGIGAGSTFGPYGAAIGGIAGGLLGGLSRTRGGGK